MTERGLKTTVYDSNPLLHWPEEASKISTVKNIVLIEASKFMPLKIKNTFLRLIGIEIGKDTAIGLSVQFDIFFPEEISMGNSTVVGYGSTILSHETTVDEFRKGETVIGDEVLIGANSTVLPGIEIEDGATVGAGAVVTEDVPEDTFVTGAPAKPRDD